MDKTEIGRQAKEDERRIEGSGFSTYIDGGDPA